MQLAQQEVRLKSKREVEKMDSLQKDTTVLRELLDRRGLVWVVMALGDACNDMQAVLKEESHQKSAAKRAKALWNFGAKLIAKYGC